MIPSFILIPGAIWPVLPPGVHDATIEEVRDRYAINPKRTHLFDGFKRATDNIFSSGSDQVFLDGSFVTAKPHPSDYDGLWDTRNVDPDLIDPVFINLKYGTDQQKRKYYGEFFPSSMIELGSLKPFMDFFTTDRITGKEKGMIRIINYLKTGGSI